MAQSPCISASHQSFVYFHLEASRQEASRWYAQELLVLFEHILEFFQLRSATNINNFHDQKLLSFLFLMVATF